MASGNDRRGEIRPRVLKGGTIITDAESSEIACTLRNQHAHGAELRVPPETVLPSEFLVYVPLDDIAYEAEVIWRRNERVGVRFVATQPKPRFHYG